MNKKILKIALREFNILRTQYDGFINVAVDNWRGYRFIFDTASCTRCKYGCSKCPLYLLLKDKKEGIFSAGLYIASGEDKKLFGPQKYLNCKSLKQYQECYTNFLVQKTDTEKEIREELKLLKNFRIIFSRKGNDLEKLEEGFRQSVIDETLKRVNGKKRQIIMKFAIDFTKS